MAAAAQNAPVAARDVAPKTPLQTSAYMLAAAFIALSQSLGQGFLSANLVSLGGELGATQSEAMWLMVAFMAPRACLPLILIKLRTQFGLRRFAEVSILVYAAVAVLSVFTTDLRSALVVEFLSGVAAAPLSTLAFLYMLEPLSPEKKLTTGLPLALTVISLGTPLARALNPVITTDASWINILVLNLGMALVCLGLVYRLPLESAPTSKVIMKLDLLSFSLIAAAFTGLVACFTTGAVYWWVQTPWIGLVMAGSVAALVVALLIELYRRAPLLDVRWLTSPAMLHLTAALLTFRIILSEQTAGAPGLFRALGFSQAQTAPLFWLIAIATLAGGLVLAVVLKPERVPAIHVVALTAIALGAAIDTRSGTMMAPADMMLSQGLIGFASGLFLPSAMAAGLLAALRKGPQYLLSFIIVFLSSQILGGTIGAGLFRTFVTERTAVHAARITEHLSVGDPLVAERIGQLSAQLGGAFSDPAAIHGQALAQLGAAVRKTATVSAYNDVFATISMLALAALAVLALHILFNHLVARRIPTGDAVTQ